MKKIFKYKTVNRMDDAGGFTLIEVLMAMAVLTIGLLAIGSVQISAINGNSTGKMTSQAASFASDQMERLLALDFTDAQLNTGNYQRQEGSYSIDWTIANAATPNTRLITVTVTSANPVMQGKQMRLRALKTASI
ncbi:MAG: prepilin-type N-terminal cleavage/methylation domain-containing protein [Deltaproteobacteria bacterium]|nr:prepilin-type N-terminal cleavage/methylation domain-containing protein [Deltaproteobacteria bacterium]